MEEMNYSTIERRKPYYQILIQPSQVMNDL